MENYYETMKIFILKLSYFPVLMKVNKKKRILDSLIIQKFFLFYEMRQSTKLFCFFYEQ